MNSRRKKTLEAIISRPTKGNILFSDIEGLVKALEGDVRDGAGSRLVFELGGQRKYMHRPHPDKDAKKYQIDDLRDWLTKQEVKT